MPAPKLPPKLNRAAWRMAPRLALMTLMALMLVGRTAADGGDCTKAKDCSNNGSCSGYSAGPP